MAPLKVPGHLFVMTWEMCKTATDAPRIRLHVNMLTDSDWKKESSIMRLIQCDCSCPSLSRFIGKQSSACSMGGSMGCTVLPHHTDVRGEGIESNIIWLKIQQVIMIPLDKLSEPTITLNGC